MSGGDTELGIGDSPIRPGAHRRHRDYPWRWMGGCRVRIETAASWVTPGGCFCRLTWGGGQGWTLIGPLVVGGGQFSALIFLVLVVSNGGVLVELVVVVSPPRPFPGTGLSPPRKSTSYTPLSCEFGAVPMVWPSPPPKTPEIASSAQRPIPARGK